MKKKVCCVLVYNSFLDPLFQNLMYQYMRTLTSDLQWTFHLITFEQPEHIITKARMEDYVQELRAVGITWHPKKHHTGKALLFKKGYDFISVFILLLRLRIKGVKIIWSFANVAASISWVYSRILGMKTIIYSYEPHAKFMAELGLWKETSWRYKILNFLETKAGIEGDYVLTGTRFMEEELRPEKTRGKIFRAPTGVDENEFYFRAGALREVQVRHNFSAEDKIVLYVGKFGGLYYTDEILLLFKILNDHIPKIRFVVITSNPWTDIVQYCNKLSFDPERITYLTKVPAEAIKIYISASHLGISAVPPTPSQKFRSPTKVAEYLLCGLPFITCKGISEDDVVAERDKVGIVVQEFSETAILKAMPAIISLLQSDRDEIVARCRLAGLTYRAKSNVDRILKYVFNELSD